MKNLVRLFLLGILFCAATIYAQPTPGAFLGVYLADVNEARAHELKLPQASGALVGKVIENSPAAAAGLRENDVIVAFDNQTIQQAANVYMLLAEALPGSSVLLKIIRNGNEQDVTVIVADRQGETASSATANQYYATVKQLRLGVKTAPLSEQLAQHFGIKGKAAVLVTEVEPRTLAERAGVKAGDCLLTVNDEPISSATDINRALNQSNKPEKNERKTELHLTIVRAEKEQQLSVKLVEPNN